MRLALAGRRSAQRGLHTLRVRSEGATYAWLACTAAVPIVLYFLKGARAWRIGVFVIWLVWVSLFVNAALKM
jgi:hypothetical protein